MKTMLNVSILSVLLAVVPRPCYALWSFGPVSKERAKQLGMEVRSKADGTNGVSLELEIKTEGELKIPGPFKQVELQIRLGETNVVSRILKEDRSKPGQITVRFTADHAQLDKIILRVWVWGGVGGVIHELRVEDFAGLEKGR